jgi:hypothetical protein
MKYWGTSKYDNRTSVARAVQKQVEDELALVKKIAVEEKAAKTTEAIDALVKQKQDRYKKVSRELNQQRREALQAQSSRGGARSGGRTSGRSRGGRSSSGLQASGGGTAGAYGDGGAYGPGTGETGRPGRPTRAAEQLDRATQDEIRQWTQATMDNKPDLAKTVHPQIHAEFAMIRRVAVEEEAKKTTAAIEGVLLARQVRFDVYVKMADALQRSVAPGQNPGTAGRYGEEGGRTTGGRRRTTRGVSGANQQQTTQRGGRTRRR